ncbi:MAG: methyltransferase domain-containing protein [Campylobacterota bacterium]|nr:methyltransferase domain-containing protein [Campylobacterota bacterium]
MEEILNKVEKLYTDSLKEHGTSSKAVGWTTGDGQMLRFDKLIEVIEDRNEAFSVNDLGCGYGSMFEYFEKNGFNISKYNGYDISEEMLKSAKEQIGKSQKVELFKNPKLQTKADYSFVSGIFNVRFEGDDESWIKFIEDTLIDLDTNSTKGFAFNVLTSYVDYKEPHLYYADPMYFFDFCKRNFSKKVSLLHDYNLWEWTIIVKKDS